MNALLAAKYAAAAGLPSSLLGLKSGFKDLPPEYQKQLQRILDNFARYGFGSAQEAELFLNSAEVVGVRRSIDFTVAKDKNSFIQVSLKAN